MRAHASQTTSASTPHTAGKRPCYLVASVSRAHFCKVLSPIHVSNCATPVVGRTIFLRSGTLTLQDTIFERNRAGRGAAIFVDTGAADRPPNLMIDGCTFDRNHANEGGAIFIKDDKALDVGWGISSSTFTANEPDASCVAFHGVTTGTKTPLNRAWSNAEASNHRLPAPGIVIKCDPSSTPTEYCPGGVPCPASGKCPASIS